jgi:hypothetical protein
MISLIEPTKTTRLVYFDDTGSIKTITGRILENNEDTFTYFELEDIIEFIEGTKKFTDFAVTRTDKPLIFEIVKKKADVRQRNVKNQIHKITDAGDTDIVIEAREGSVTIYANDDLVKKSGVKKNQSVTFAGTDMHPFFVTHKDKPDFIISTLLVSFSDILSGEKVSINFEHKYDVSIYTKKYFDTYTLRRV